jgi:hypothetical protein
MNRIITLIRRAIFFVPAQIVRCLFVLIIYLGWGYKSSTQVWRMTR